MPAFAPWVELNKSKELLVPGLVELEACSSGVEELRLFLAMLRFQGLGFGVWGLGFRV